MLASRELEEADNPKIIDPRSRKAFCLRQQADLPNYLLLRLTLQAALPRNQDCHVCARVSALAMAPSGQGQAEAGCLLLRGKLRQGWPESRHPRLKKHLQAADPLLHTGPLVLESGY